MVEWQAGVPVSKNFKSRFANYPLSPIFAVLFASKWRKILKNKH
jgi:hypothetical protein